MSRKEWFGEWFDSPYYHILYRHRDKEEAEYFIDNLLAYLNPEKDAKMMDLACGKGRHSIYLNKKGYYVTGLDLSPSNIEYARKYSNDRLVFNVHDMREVYHEQKFDYIFNLFTSFGYFETKEEHRRTIKAIKGSLKPGGYFVLDFLNPYVVINELIEEEVKRLEGIEFHIKRYVENGYIIKRIEFYDEGERFNFYEKVKTIRRREFEEFFKEAGLKLKHTFGSYELDDYHPERSQRLIFITQA